MQTQCHQAVQIFAYRTVSVEHDLIGVSNTLALFESNPLEPIWRFEPEPISRARYALSTSSRESILHPSFRVEFPLDQRQLPAARQLPT